MNSLFQPRTWVFLSASLAFLTLRAAPTITTPPVAQTVAAGSSVSLSVAATGSGSLSYQWKKEGVNVAAANATGATSPTLSLSNVALADTGNYSVVVTDADGTTATSPVAVTVNIPRALLAISTRSSLASSHPELSAAFTIEGTGSKQVLVRAAGPALAKIGVQSALADPAVAITDRTGAIVASNSDWTADMATVMGNVGAFPFDSGSKDAAVVVSLPPGTYTVRAYSAVPSGVGVCLLEIYDADTATIPATRFSYLAMRAYSGSGSDNFIAGFAVGGTTRNFLYRVLGPSLGIAGAAADCSTPMMYKNTSGSSVVWTIGAPWGTASSAPAVVGAQSTAGAMPLPDGSKDVAAITSLSPGTYSISMAGTGMELFELHEIDAYRTAQPPAFVSTPGSGTVVANLGDNVALGHVYVGSPAPTLTWKKDGTLLPTATSASLSISSLTSADVGTYELTATNSAGTTTATYQVQTPVAPTITSQPANQAIAIGGAATFTVAATGLPAPTYQWLLNGRSIAGATGLTYTVTNAQLADAGVYAVTVTNAVGTVTSHAATLGGPNPAPTLTAQPQNLTITSGSTATLNVTASSTGALAYQWRRNGVAIAGATTATYSIPSATRIDADVYDVRVSDGLSLTISQPVWLSVSPTAYPQAVALDRGFAAMVEGQGKAAVTKIVTAPTGEYFVVGSFRNIDGQPRVHAAKFSAAGALDTTFRPALDGAGTVNTAALQSDGKLLVAGGANLLFGSAQRLVRLNTDGGVDSTFAAPIIDGDVLTVVVQSDGKILVGGTFTDTSRGCVPRLVRLNVDGTVDRSFYTMLDREVYAIAVQPDNNIIIGGAFGTINGRGRLFLARLTSNGALDTTFDPGAGPNGFVTAVALATDTANAGKIVIGGYFVAVNGSPRVMFARVTSTGALDPNFVVTSGGPGLPYAVVCQPDGGVFVSCSSFIYDRPGSATGVARFAKLKADGWIDTAFPHPAFVGDAYTVAVQSDGGLLVGGGGMLVSTLVDRYALLRLAADGSLDFSFGPTLTAPGAINAVVPVSATQVVVGGTFGRVNGVARANLARINVADGSIDSTFPTFGEAVQNLYRQPDGKIVVTTSSGVVLRLNVDGTAEGDFNRVYSGASGVVPSPGGQLIVYGYSITTSATTRYALLRVNGDGSVDSTFNPPLTSMSGAAGAAVQPDGKVLAVGIFTFPGAQSPSYVVRFEATGAIDTTFTPPALPSFPSFVALQHDGKILLSGSFTYTAGGHTYSRFLRLNADGSVDSTFNSDGSAPASVSSVVLQEDGRVLVVGAGTYSQNGTTGAARWLANGNFDASFATRGLTPPAQIGGGLLCDDGSLLMWGNGGLPNVRVSVADAFFDRNVVNPSLARLVAVGSPAITTQPQSQTANLGDNVAFSVVASGTAPLSYQWYRGGVAISGATNTSLTLTNVQWADQVGSYSVAVSNVAGTVTSNGASLTVQGKPAITALPPSQSVDPGASLRLSVKADGANAVWTFQWFKDGVAISGATTSSMTVPTAQPGDAGNYTVAVTNASGTTTSAPVAITVTGKPAITAGPASRNVTAGASAELVVTAAGSGTLTYQWRKNGVPLAGATSATLALAAVSVSDVGTYDVVVTNATGSTASGPAAVTIDSPLLDEGFSPPLFASESPGTFMTRLSDGSIVQFGSALMSSLARLHTAPIVRYLADGTRDVSFEQNLPADMNAPAAVTATPAGKFYFCYQVEHAATAQASMRLVRCFNDGRLDATFAATEWAASPITQDVPIRKMLPLSNGQLLVAGFFKNIGGHAGIARFNADGTLDSTFGSTTMAAANGVWAAPVVDADGKILLAGDFGSFNGVNVPGVVRLNPDGTTDTTFRPWGFIRNNPIRGLFVQSTGKIVLGGGRFSVNGQGIYPLIRLNEDGSIDRTFAAERMDPVNSYPPSIRDLQPIGSDKFAATGLTLYVCNADGSFDSSFAQPVLGWTGASATPAEMFSLECVSDGYLVAGNFDFVNGVYRPNLVKLSSTGVVQPAHGEMWGSFQYPLTFTRSPTGHVLAVLSTSQAPSNIPASGCVDLMPDGRPAVVPFATGFDDIYTVSGVAALADGRLLALAVTNANGLQLKRVQLDGTPDTTFATTAVAANETFDRVFPLSDGGALLWSFETYTNRVMQGAETLARVKPDGTRDTSFVPTWPNAGATITRDTNNNITRAEGLAIKPLAVDSSGAVYVRYRYAGGLVRLARLLASGAVDSSFALVTVPEYPNLSSFVSTVTDPVRPSLGSISVTFQSPRRRELADAIIQSDGKIVIGGEFTAVTINGTSVPAHGIVRLNADGTVDTTFASSQGLGWSTPVDTSYMPAAESIVQQPDGRLLVAGTFESYDGQSAPGLMRLNADGSRDTTYVAPVARRLVVATSSEMRMQPDGSVLLSGPYQVPGELQPRGLVRLFTGLPLAIGTQPQSATVASGGSVTFTAGVNGPGPLIYQWLRNGTAINGATNASYTIASTVPADAGNYTLTVSGPAGTITTTAAVLTVNYKPVITAQPQSVTVSEEQSSSFTVGANGIPAITYQWKKDGVAVPGATAATHSIPVTKITDAGSYTVDVTNAQGTTTSAAATLTVNPVPPSNASVGSTFFHGLVAGASTVLSANATGTAPLSYQWMKDGAAIADATNATCTLRFVTPAETGVYTVRVTSSLGSATTPGYPVWVQQEHGWEWCAPLPTGTLLTSALFANGEFLVGGTRGTLLVSADGITWTTRRLPTSSNLAGLAYGGGVYAAAGFGGVYTSTDAKTWTPRNPGIPADAPFYSAACLTYGANRFVLAQGKSLSVSNADASAWTVANLVTTDPILSVGFVNGRFVATEGAFGLGASGPGQVHFSTDGQSWTSVTTPNIFLQIAYGAGTYVGVGNDAKLYASTDLANWAPVATSNTAPLETVVFVNNRFVATSPAGVVSNSVDGQTWTSTNFSVMGTSSPVVYGNGAYVGTWQGSPSGLMRSTDALVWTNELTTVSAGSLNGIAAGTDGTLVAVGASGRIVTSPDGVAWTPHNSGTSDALAAVAYGANAFVAVSGSGIILSSTDGSTWTDRSPGVSPGPKGVRFGNGVFVATAQGSVLTSPDGAAWTKVSIPSSTVLSNSAFGNTSGGGVWVAIGVAGAVMRSTDNGVTWTAVTSGTTSTLNDVCYAAGKFVAVGDSAVVTSTDGQTWAVSASPERMGAVTYAGGTFLAAGATSANYWVSADGTNWTARFTGAHNLWNQFTVAGNRLYAVGGGGIIQSAGAPSLQPPPSEAIPGGRTAVFTAQPYGAAVAATYQWQKKPAGGTAFADLNGATSAIFTLTNVTLADAGEYRLVATNGFGSATSTSASLAVTVPAAIVTQPQPLTVTAGQIATLHVVATGGPTPTYQWQKKAAGGTTFADVSGATTDTLTFASALPGDAGEYRVVVSNPGTNVTSSVVTLTVSGAAPAFTTQPAVAEFYRVGDQLTLASAATGLPAPTYQWYRQPGGSTTYAAIPGATTSTLSFANMALTDNGSYRVVATNVVGSATSSAVNVVVYDPPAITASPALQTIVAGGTATFSATVTGTPTPTLQWRRNGLNIVGATGGSLTLSNVPYDGGGTITLVASNPGGSAVSSGLALNVNPVAPVISSPGTAVGVVGRSFLYQVTTMATQVSYDASGLPAGLAINRTTGLITGTPTVTGTFKATLTAANVTNSDTKVVTITINPAPPIINSAAAAAARVGQTFAFSVSAANQPTSFAATGLPAGLTLNATTGAISGTPTTSGTFTVTLTATNAGGITSAAFTLTIAPPLNAPKHAGTTQLSGVQKSAFSFTPVFDTSGLVTTFTATGLPAGLVISSTTGAITGTPSATGTFDVEVSATSSGGTTKVTFTMTVNPPPSAPVITSNSSTGATVGVAFSFTLTASGTPTGYAVAELPALGLSLNSTTGVISGTPTDPGTLELHVTASNAVGTSAESVLVITVSPAPDAPIIDSASQLSGRVGVAFSATLHASNTPTSFTVSSGTLPAGLNLDATTGVISGTPQEVGQTPVWLAATNAHGRGYALQVLFTIAPAPTMPVITSNGAATAQVGQPFSYQITATNVPTSFGAAGLPGGLSLDVTTGLITGMPLEATKTPVLVTLTARNADGTSSPKPLLLTIVPAPATPVITSPSSATGQVGAAFTYQITASETPTSFLASSLPPGLTIGVSDGKITGTPTTAGTYTVTLRAGNVGGLGAAATLIVSIEPAPSAPVITSDASATGKVGVAFTYTIRTNTAATSFAVAPKLPLGLSLNTSTGVIGGMPAVSGVFAVSLTATGIGGTSLPQQLVLNLSPADNVPVITSATYVTATVGQSFTYQITAAGSPAFPTAPFPAPFAMDAVNLPDGLAVNPSTGVIEGTPTSAGTYAATLLATNSAGTGPQRTLTFYIAPAPQAPEITSVRSAAGQVGVSFSYQITANNRPSMFDVVGAPEWMTVNSATGALAGVPTTPGTTTIRISATNSAGSGPAVGVVITVAPGASAPTITSPRVAPATVGRVFTYQITAAVPSGSPPVTQYVATGLPRGLSLNPITGGITGTPAVSGQFQVTLTAQNAAGASAPVPLTIMVLPNLKLNGGS